MRALILFLLSWLGWRWLGWRKEPPALPADVPTDPPKGSEANTARYWGKPEIDAAIERARAQEKAGEPDPGADIDYPVCDDCGKRHPSSEYLQANGLAICRECGRVGKARDTDLLGGGASYEWARLPAHKNEHGRWCRGRGHHIPDAGTETVH